MIGIRLNGGLGNQMFQYACGRALAIRQNTNLVLDIADLKKTTNGSTVRDFELGIFNINAVVATAPQLKQLKPLTGKIINLLAIKAGLKGAQSFGYYTERSFSYNQGINKLRGDVYLIGYWQSWRYFEHVRQIIRDDFTFPALNEQNANTAQNIKDTESISIHIRRGDFLNKKSHSIHGICSLSYYQDAIRYISSKLINPVFFIFSDDVEWAKGNLDVNSNSHFISDNMGSNSYIDMQLMAICKHNIIANSSFSWWGAWLNNNVNKIVIAPNQWFTDTAMNLQTDDLTPAGWIRI